MWKKPIRKEGARESDFAYNVKLIWIKTKYDDVYNKLTTKKIIENIKKYSEITSIPITDTANYATVTETWVKKYCWHECYKAYEEEMTQESKTKALLIFDKKLLKDTIQDFQTIDKIDNRTSKLFKQQEYNEVDNTYKIAKLEETKNSIWHRIVERLDLTTDDDVEEVQDYLHVANDPAHESSENREFWNNILWDLVDKR